MNVDSRLRTEPFKERIIRKLQAAEASPEPLPQTDSGIYIYGAGELGSLALEYCESCDIPVKGFLDQTKSGLFPGRRGNYEITPPASVDHETRKKIPVAVAIVNLPFEPIRRQLESLGWSSVFPFYKLTSQPRRGHPLGNGWLIPPASQDEIAAVEWVCDKWADEMSLAHYEAFIAWHTDNTEVDLKRFPIDPKQRYAIEPLLAALGKRDRQMVDVGAHRGESIKRLADAGISFSEYAVFEPDDASREVLLSAIKGIVPPESRINVFDGVVGETQCSRPYQSDLGYCSQIWVESETEKQVVPLDCLDLAPDFLKIHTEGSEWDVLLGGAKTIAESRPCIAFSVYHTRDGFCRMIADAMKMFPGYRWLFRLHSFQGTGAFVYAIPE